MREDSKAVPATVRVRMEAGPPQAARYDILIRAGLLAETADLVPAVVPAHRYAVITDSNVAALHARTVSDGLASAGHCVQLLEFPAGETSKNREVWTRLTDEMVAAGFGRDSCIIAVGGGVVGDLAGFVAATYMRGIPLVNVPTTLLAMLDSSIGGKTGVDTAEGKNLVGTFHQPRLVVIDPTVLTTLPDAQYRASMAEAIKHGVILDAAYFDWIEDNVAAVVARDPDIVSELVRRSVEIKAAVVAEDTFEAGRRAILNFGHTIGHAIERVTEFRVPHGNAVAIGMVIEARIGEALGVTAGGTAARIASLTGEFGLPATLTNAGAEVSALVGATRSDKKARGAAVRYSLVAGIGSSYREADGAWTTDVPDSVVQAAAEAAANAISQARTEF